MSWLTFFSNAIAALAWPTASFAIVLLLRKPLRSLLPLVQRLKYKELEVEFGRRVEEVRADVVRELPRSAQLEMQPSLVEGPFAALAALSPRSAVLEAWREVELAALEAARRLGGHELGEQTLTYRAIKFLERQERLDSSVISLLRDLRDLRNQAAHAPEFVLSKESALEYVKSTHVVASYLRGLAGIAEIELPSSASGNR
jgi:hypothetical protein